jgi:hypothetical protein
MPGFHGQGGALVETGASVMPAIVALEGVKITRINLRGHMGVTQLDGVVTLHARSDAIEFKYAYEFKDSQAGVTDIVNSAVNALKRELLIFERATQDVFVHSGMPPAEFLQDTRQ